MKRRIKAGLIGFGRMGEFYLDAMRKSDDWEVVYICDISPVSRAYAASVCPDARITSDCDTVFSDESIDVVVLSTLADSRKELITKALSSGKHIIAEKPIAACPEDEKEMVSLAEASDRITAVDLYLRNSWYHTAIKDFIGSGEIGELAIIRVCHMTPGLAPGEGHEYEGPAFHDCGMHYVDIARWYAGSEYKTWHAQALRMWDYKDPWWLQCHGTFMNGIVFDITQGFVYGQTVVKGPDAQFIRGPDRDKRHSQDDPRLQDSDCGVARSKQDRAHGKAFRRKEHRCAVQQIRPVR